MIGLVFDARYRLDCLAGEGGCGAVYRGVDLRLGRPVAIKVLHSHLRHRAWVVERFEREARAAARVDHPHVVRVYHHGEAQGRPYLVFGWVDGTPLGGALATLDGPLPWPVVAEIGRQLCEGLAALHGVGVVHRDVKPANVMLSRTGVAVLIDLGLARLADSELTIQGGTAGTVAYMAPEQAADARRVDGRSDLYALGVSLAELATGVRPLPGGLTDAELEPESAECLNWPREFESLLRFCRAREPQRRPQSAEALGESLRALAAGAGFGPTSAMRLWAQGQACFTARVEQASPLGAAHARRDSTLEAAGEGAVATLGYSAASASSSAADTSGEAPYTANTVSRARRSRRSLAVATVLAISLLSTPSSSPPGREAPPIEGETRFASPDLHSASSLPPLDASQSARPVESAPKEPPAPVANVAERRAAPSQPTRATRAARAARAVVRATLPREEQPDPGESGAAGEDASRVETAGPDTRVAEAVMTKELPEAEPASAVQRVDAQVGAAPVADSQPARVEQDAGSGQRRSTLHLVVRFGGRASWAQLEVDGRPRGAVHTLQLALAPGARRIVATRPGFRDISRDVLVEEGAVRKVFLDLQASAAVPDATPTAAAAR